MSTWSADNAISASESQWGEQRPFGPSFDHTRARTLTKSSPVNADGECVMYWMCRDNRVKDNHAMLAARGLAKEVGVPLKVLFPFYTSFGDMSLRQFTFMAEGLKEVEKDCRELKIPFSVEVSAPDDLPDTVLEAAKTCKAAAVVTDHMPLRAVKAWTIAAASGLDAAGIPLFQVDAANVVPVWVASWKQEVGARTLRPKINSLYGTYLKPFPDLEANVIDVEVCCIDLLL